MNSRFLSVMITSALVTITSASANSFNSDLARAERLLVESQQLERDAQWSNIHYGLKDEISRFVVRVSALASCERTMDRPGYGYPGYPSPGYPGDNYNNSRDCEVERYQVMEIFSNIARYLRDTAHNSQALSRQFQRVQLIISELQNDNGGIGNTPIRQLRAVGMMETLRFRLFGNTSHDIYQQCLNFGYSRRLSYIRNLVVNGQRFGGGYGVPSMNLQQACSLVSRHAR